MAEENDTRVLNERLLGEVAEEVRRFLRATWTGPDEPTDPEYLEGGRALIEDFAIQAAAHRDDPAAARRGQDLNLDEVAQVLNYLSMLKAREGHDCFGHDGHFSACGYTSVLIWLHFQVSRHARKRTRKAPTSTCRHHLEVVRG